MSQFFDNQPDVRQLTCKDGKVFDQYGVELSVQETNGFNHILRPQKVRYNAKMFADLTNTPIHFWEQATDVNKQYLMSIIEPELERLGKKLFKYRELSLKKVYKRRSARAVNSRNRKIAEAEKSENIATQNG
jgi:hypothetical protein